MSFKSVAPNGLVTLQCADPHQKYISSTYGFNMLFKKQREYNIWGDRKMPVDLGGVRERNEGGCYQNAL